MGGVNQPLEVPSLPFSFPLPFPLPPLPLSPSFPPPLRGSRGCCAKVGGINPPEGVWETPWCYVKDRATLHLNYTRRVHCLDGRWHAVPDIADRDDRLAGCQIELQ